MFEIINDEKKQIVFSLHLEQIYTEMRLKTHIKEKVRLFSKDTLSKSCVDYLSSLQFKNEKYKEYECIIDFMHIKYMVQNMREKFFDWIEELPNVTVCNCENFDLYQEIERKEIAEDNNKNYRDAFNEYGKKYILERCCDPEGYTTQIGTRLSVYIDLKRIINDSVEMLRWCYIIAYDLNDYFSRVRDDEPDKKNLFFCHTMNGAYIAGILSQLLGCDLVYVDHLGPYNKLNKVDFYKGKSRSEEFIIVADMVCLGNEFLRAKNIVEYSGGTVSGCVGILKLDISNILNQYSINAFGINYAPEEAQKELSYIIRTKLCNGHCEECNEERA